MSTSELVLPFFYSVYSKKPKNTLEMPGMFHLFLPEHITMTNHGSQKNSESFVRPKRMPTGVGTQSLVQSGQEHTDKGDQSGLEKLLLKSCVERPERHYKPQDTMPQLCRESTTG